MSIRPPGTTEFSLQANSLGTYSALTNGSSHRLGLFATVWPDLRSRLHPQLNSSPSSSYLSPTCPPIREPPSRYRFMSISLINSELMIPSKGFRHTLVSFPQPSPRSNLYTASVRRWDKARQSVHPSDIDARRQPLDGVLLTEFFLATWGLPSETLILGGTKTAHISGTDTNIGTATIKSCLENTTIILSPSYFYCSLRLSNPTIRTGYCVRQFGSFVELP